MNKLLSTFLLSWWLILTSPAQAGIYIEITGGQTGGLPIAVVPFGVTGSHHQENLEDIAKIIQADLGNSGQFKPYPRPAMQHYPTAISEVRYPYWQQLQIENLIVGKITKSHAGYTINFSLLDIVKGQAGATTAPLLALQFDNIAPAQFRALAHHISDLIFEKLIGIKGAFSTRIAYVGVKEEGKNILYTLEVADYDGVNPKILKKSYYPLMSPAWSPDGKKLAYVTFDKNRSAIQVVELATLQMENITQYPGINGAPTFSPDGRSLGIVLSKDGSPKIYLVDLASKNLTKITQGTTIDTEPRFTPDGQSMIFTSNRGGKAQIYRVNINTSKIERLTFKGVYNARASITADNKYLVMMHRGEEGGPFSIAVQNLVNNEFRLLTHAGLDESPTIAPNGTMVLYGSQDGVLGAVSLDGRVKLRLPAHAGNVQEPAWSPYVKISSN